MRRTTPLSGGVALIIVLWVLVILSMLVLSFAATVRVHTRASTNIGRRSTAYLSAVSGLERVMTELEGDVTGYDGLDEAWVYLDSHDDELLQPPNAYQVSVIDECSKLDINTASREALLALSGMTDELVDAIIDWRDENDEPEPLGAEDDHYQSLSPPYHCANRPFQTVEELLLVKGMIPELLYGYEEDRQPLSPAERARVEGARTNLSQDGEAVALIDLLTVYSISTQEASDGELRLDANEATADQIAERLAADLDPEVAQDIGRQIERYRSGDRRFTRVADLWNVGGIRSGDAEQQRAKMAAVVDKLGIAAGESEQEERAPGGEQPPEEQQGPGGGPEIPPAPQPGGQMPQLPGGGGRGGSGSGAMPRSLLSIINAQLLAQQPRQPTGQPNQPGGFPQQPEDDRQGRPEDEGAPGEELEGGAPPLLEEPMAGLININTAPIEVLATLPGMTEELANAIVSHRESESFASRGAIVELQNVEPEALEGILDHITVTSSAYCMYALGSIDETEIAVHVTAVIDTSQSPARIRYFRQDN